MSCPPRKISRKAYSRKTSSGKRVSVKRTCVPDKGKPGKTPKSKQVLPKPSKEISLSKYGYSTQKTETKRRASLRAASRDLEDPLVVLRRLNLIRNYQADPATKRKMSKDVTYMKQEYAKYKNKN